VFIIIYSNFSDDTSREIQPNQLKRKHSEERITKSSKKARINNEDIYVIKIDCDKNIGKTYDEEGKVKNYEKKINNDTIIEETEMDTNENEELTKNAEKINVKPLENSKGVASGLKTSLHGTIFQVFLLLSIFCHVDFEVFY
jgi:hypothetical protein